MAMPVMGGYDAISLPVASTSAQPAAQQWGVWQQGQGGSLAPTESQGAPPVTQWWPQRRRKEDCEPDGAAAGPGVVHVAAPRIEAQPWVRPCSSAVMRSRALLQPAGRRPFRQLHAL